MSEELYLWDNWVCRYRGLLHRFSLAAPKTVPPEQRHERAAIHRWTSADGESWEPHGEAVGPGPSERAAWSGSAVDIGDKLALFYTGVGEDLSQTIRVAFSQGGKAFAPHPEPALPPSTHVYDTGDSDGVVMAWRDPFVFRHPDDGTWHMLFSAKRKGARPLGCVGHATAGGDRLTSWEPRLPLDLPAHAQMETPCVFFEDGQVYCVVSTSDGASEDERESGRAVRAYRARDLKGPWEPAGAKGDVVLDWTAKVYAVSVHKRGPGDLLATGFFTRSHPRAHTWTPLMPVRLDQGRVGLLP